MNIEVLVERAKDGDKSALEEIIKLYRPFVVKSALKIFIAGSDMEDLIQDGCISIMNAVRLYEKSEGSNFTSYVTNAINKNFFYAIRKAARRNYDCSLDMEASEGMEFIDCIPDKFNIEEDYIRRENIINLRTALKTLEVEELKLMTRIYNDERESIKRISEKFEIKYSTLIKRRNKIIRKLRLQLLCKTTSEKPKR